MDHVDAYAIPAGTRFRRHEHGTAHVCAVLAGGFVERERDGWRDAGPGTIRVSGPARHDCDFGSAGARCLLLEVDDVALDAPDAARFLKDSRLTGLARRIDAAVSSDDPGRGFDVPGLTAELLARIARLLDGRAGHPPPWLDEARALLHDTDGAVAVAELAAAAGVHRVHLARTFRDHVGVPVTVYARRLRLVAARREIAAGLPLARAAVRAGFVDQSHLTRTMKDVWGLTPGALRRSLHRYKTDPAAPGHP